MIKILFLSANPKGTTKLAIDTEVRSIKERLRQSSSVDEFQIITEWAVRTTDLASILIKTHPDIVHFSGHGEHSGIILEDHQGTLKPVPPDALAKLFSSVATQVKCVMLNSCYSEAQARAIASSIPAAVIGMNNFIEDESAIVFSSSFYESLSLGQHVAKAFEIACINIQIENRSGHDIPQLISVKIDPSKVVFTIVLKSSTDEASTGKATSPGSVMKQNSTASALSKIPDHPGKDPSSLFVWALSHVPELKYGLGVAGLVSLIAIVRSWGIEPSLAAIGVIVVLILMVGLLLFTRLDKASSRHIQLPMLALLYAFTAIIIAVASFLFTAVFFGWPTIRVHPFSDSGRTSIDTASTVSTNHPKPLDASASAGAQVVERPSPALRTGPSRTETPETQQTVTVRIKASIGKTVEFYDHNSVIETKSGERWLKSLPTGNLPDGSGAVFRLSLHPGLYRIRCSGGFGTSEHQIQIRKGKDSYEAECDHP